MNPRARRLRRLRRESYRKAWRSKAARNARLRASVGHAISEAMIKALRGPHSELIDVTPLPGCSRTQVNTRTGEVTARLEVDLKRVYLSLTFGDAPILAQASE